jgi:flagellar basal-body rod modification protein FlgD
MQTGMIEAAQPPAKELTPKKPSNNMDKNAFLSLLVAQLKNQDPTQSQDPSQMVQQMTSFSTLEQAQNTNSLLTGLQSQGTGIYQTNSASLIGKHVRVASSSLDLKAGKASVGVDLETPAKVTINITDSHGQTLRQLKPGSMAAGTNMVDWDGKDTTGNKLPDGTYGVTIVAVGADGNPAKAGTSAFMTVRGVSFENGKVMLSAGGKQFPLADITEISA